MINSSYKSSVEKLIDVKRWEYIKQTYPAEVEKRMSEETKNSKENTTEKQRFLKKQLLIQQEEEQTNTNAYIRQIVSVLYLLLTMIFFLIAKIQHLRPVQSICIF